jgi:hypothetical protein
MVAVCPTFKRNDPKFYISVDLGQAADYTAISVLEKISEDIGHIRHLERLTLGMPYPEQVSRVKGIFDSISDAQLIVDYTGVGRPVVDLMREVELNPVKITITGGNEASKTGKDWHVPKRDLVFGLITGLQTGKIRIASNLPFIHILEKELANFKMKVNINTANASFEAREGEHDDMVLSLAMAVYASGVTQHKVHRGIFYGSA